MKLHDIIGAFRRAERQFIIMAIIKQIQWLITQKIDIVKLYQLGLIVAGVGVAVWIVSCSKNIAFLKI